MLSQRTGSVLLMAATLVVILAALFAPAVPQPGSYHHFADQRGWLGFPRFGDVASNVPFRDLGPYLSRRKRLDAQIHRSSRAISVWSRLPRLAPYGVRLKLLPSGSRQCPTGLGSHPDDRSLHVAGGRDDRRTRLCPARPLAVTVSLLALGVGSVLQWYGSELRGAGDLRWYAAVQVYAMVVLLTVLLLPARYTRSSDLLVVAGFYVLAKALESSDQLVFSWGHMVSGHTLKHLAASAAGYWILRMLQRRQPLPAAPTTGA